jgi:hypothetical protein
MDDFRLPYHPLPRAQAGKDRSALYRPYRTRRPGWTGAFTGAIVEVQELPRRSGNQHYIIPLRHAGECCGHVLADRMDLPESTRNKDGPRIGSMAGIDPICNFHPYRHGGSHPPAEQEGRPCIGADGIGAA